MAGNCLPSSGEGEQVQVGKILEEKSGTKLIRSQEVGWVLTSRLLPAVGALGPPLFWPDLARYWGVRGNEQKRNRGVKYEGELCGLTSRIEECQPLSHAKDCTFLWTVHS